MAMVAARAVLQITLPGGASHELRWMRSMLYPAADVSARVAGARKTASLPGDTKHVVAPTGPPPETRCWTAASMKDEEEDQHDQ